ncbi:5681_t:CDS:2, partial [Scutellospora calospora]
RLPFPDEEFDYIFSRGNENFFKDDVFQGFLSEVLRVLKPGGWFEVAMASRQIYDGGPAFSLWNSGWLSWYKANNINPDLMFHIFDYIQKTKKFECIEHQTAKLFLGKGNNESGEFGVEFFLYVLNDLKEVLISDMGISSKQYNDLIKEVKIEFKNGKSNPYSYYHRIFGEKK